MSVSAITSAFSNYAQSVVGTTSAGPASAASASSSAMQEATETVAQTKKEAAHGDRVAKAKLAHEQQQQQQQQASTGPSEPGKGALIDKAA